MHTECQDWWVKARQDKLQAQLSYTYHLHTHLPTSCSSPKRISPFPFDNSLPYCVNDTGYNKHTMSAAAQQLFCCKQALALAQVVNQVWMMTIDLYGSENIFKIALALMTARAPKYTSSTYLCTGTINI